MEQRHHRGLMSGQISSTSKPDVETTRAINVDLRPSRLDINALLVGSSLSATKRQDVIEVFAQHALLYGGMHRPDPLDNELRY